MKRPLLLPLLALALPALAQDPATNAPAAAPTAFPDGIYTNVELAIEFFIDEGEACVRRDLSPDHARETLIIPETFGGAPVTGISFDAFSGCRNLRSATFPASLREIDAGAFAECGSLTNVVLGDAVKHVGVDAFRECSAIETFEIGAGLPAFSEERDYMGFAGFPRDAPNVRLRLNPANSHFRLADGALCSADGTRLVFSPLSRGLAIPASIKEIGQGAIGGVSPANGRLVVPSGVERIGADNFMGSKNLREVVLPDSIRRIDGDAFYHCPDLETIVIGAGISRIGDEAFADCPRLASVRIAATNVVIGANAFYWRDEKGVGHAPAVFEIGGAPAKLPPYDDEYGVVDGDDCDDSDDCDNCNDCDEDEKYDEDEEEIDEA
jgi:hypothetical protein